MVSEARANIGAVLIDGRALLIGGPSGSGKSILALELIDRGATLIGDDGVTLEALGKTLRASPPPRTAGLLEIRNVGLIEMHATSGPVALLVELTPEAPRYVERADTWSALGTEIPLIRLDPAIGANAIRVEGALKRHGLPHRSDTPTG